MKHNCVGQVVGLCARFTCLMKLGPVTENGITRRQPKPTVPSPNEAPWSSHAAKPDPLSKYPRSCTSLPSNCSIVGTDTFWEYFIEKNSIGSGYNDLSCNTGICKIRRVGIGIFQIEPKGKGRGYRTGRRSNQRCLSCHLGRWISRLSRSLLVH